MKEEDKYIKSKLRDIEGFVAVAVGAASMISIMTGKCNEGVIKARDEMYENIEKTVYQIIKYVKR